MRRSKKVLTTGEVAKICQVAPRTVSKWFDSGQLRGYRVPGSKDRRIPVAELVQFMREHGLPLGDLAPEGVRILIIGPDRELNASLAAGLARHGGYETETTESAFSAGLLAAQRCPNIVLVDTQTPDLRADNICEAIRSGAPTGNIKVVALATGSSSDQLHGFGFDRILVRPVTILDVLQAFDKVLGSAR
jgi:two-component system, OmpR family, response regulator RpaA